MAASRSSSYLRILDGLSNQANREDNELNLALVSNEFWHLITHQGYKRKNFLNQFWSSYSEKPGQKFTSTHEIAFVILVQEKNKGILKAIAELRSLNEAQANGIARGLTRDDVLNKTEEEIKKLLQPEPEEAIEKLIEKASEELEKHPVPLLPQSPSMDPYTDEDLILSSQPFLMKKEPAEKNLPPVPKNSPVKPGKSKNSQLQLRPIPLADEEPTLPKNLKPKKPRNFHPQSRPIRPPAEEPTCLEYLNRLFCCFPSNPPEAASPTRQTNTRRPRK